MGAKYEKSVYISETASEEETETYRDDCQSNSFSSSYSFSESVSASASGEDDGVEASASASSSSSESTESSSESSAETSTSDSSSSSTSTSMGVTSVQIFGLVDASDTECGDLLGSVDRLLPVKYNMRPLWELYPDLAGVDILQDFYNTYFDTAANCSETVCYSNGACKVDDGGFLNDFVSFESFFLQECICDEGYKTEYNCQV